MDTVVCDLALLERWLTGWSRSRGLPLPVQERGGLHVEVSWHDQVRRHVFVDAGSALQACAAGVREHFVHIKATVSNEQLLRALPAGWTAEAPRYLMSHAGPMGAASALAPEYSIVSLNEHGADVLYIVDAKGDVAATGRITQDAGTAVFDRIETTATHRRQGLASALMLALPNACWLPQRPAPICTGTWAGNFSRHGPPQYSPATNCLVPKQYLKSYCKTMRVRVDLISNFRNYQSIRL